MSRKKQLAKNTLIISFGTFLPKVVNVITLPIITACLSKAEYGAFDLISTLVFLALPITTLQIQSAAFRYLIDSRGDTKRTSNIISTMLAFVMIVSLISVAIVNLFLGSYGIITRILIAAYFYFDMLFLVLQQITRGLSFNQYYSISAIINSLVNLVVIILTLEIVNIGLEGVLLALVIATIVGCLYLFIKVKLWDYISLDEIKKDTLLELLGYSWPMVPNNISSWVLRLSNRMIISFFLGVEANAAFAVANKIPNLLSTFLMTFTYAWQENASLAAKDDDAEKYYSDVFDTVFDILVGLMALAVAATPIAFKILIRGDYDEAYGEMPILFVGMLFSCMASTLGGVYIAHKKTKSVGISTVCAAGVNLVFNILFVKTLGITSASLASLISYVLLLIYRIVDIKKFQRMTFNYSKILWWAAILILMCVICWHRTLLGDVMNAVIAIVVAFITCKDLIKSVLKKIVGYLAKK